MQKSVVECTVKDQVATITLNRPEVHNALNLVMVDSLLKTLSALSEDTSVRVIILQATGKSFCAGADLNWMKQFVTELQSDDDSIALKLSVLMDTLYHINKPTIALVQGTVLGGGIGLICCCDVVLATADSHFCFSEVRLGLIPAIISPYVVNSIGISAARRYFLTAEKFSAEKAVDLGLVDEILPRYEIQKVVKQLSINFISAAPDALARTKQLINDVAHRELDKTLTDKTAAWLIEAQSSAEAKEGIKAFFENRPASWVNTDQESS